MLLPFCVLFIEKSSFIKLHPFGFFFIMKMVGEWRHTHTVLFIFLLFLFNLFLFPFSDLLFSLLSVLFSVTVFSSWHSWVLVSGTDCGIVFSGVTYVNFSLKWEWRCCSHALMHLMFLVSFFWVTFTITSCTLIGVNETPVHPCLSIYLNTVLLFPNVLCSCGRQESHWPFHYTEDMKAMAWQMDLRDMLKYLFISVSDSLNCD